MFVHIVYVFHFVLACFESCIRVVLFCLQYQKKKRKKMKSKLFCDCICGEFRAIPIKVDEQHGSIELGGGGAGLT